MAAPMGSRFLRRCARAPIRRLRDIDTAQRIRPTASTGAVSSTGVDAPARSAVMELPEASIGEGPQCAVSGHS
jgi:hypothetical protein